MQYPQNRLIEPLPAALETRDWSTSHAAELPAGVSVNPSWSEMLGTDWPYLALALWVIVLVVLLLWLTQEPPLARTVTDPEETVPSPSSHTSRGKPGGAALASPSAAFEGLSPPAWTARGWASFEGGVPSHDRNSACEPLITRPFEGQTPTSCGSASETSYKDSGNIGNVMDDIFSGAVRKNCGSDCGVE